jgi:hypothetical protein
MRVDSICSLSFLSHCPRKVWVPVGAVARIVRVLEDPFLCVPGCYFWGNQTLLTQSRVSDVCWALLCKVTGELTHCFIEHETPRSLWAPAPTNLHSGVQELSPFITFFLALFCNNIEIKKLCCSEVAYRLRRR